MIVAIPFATAHCAQQPDASDAIPPSLLRIARRNSTPSNPSPGSAAHCAQKPDPIAGDTPRDSSNGYLHFHSEAQLAPAPVLPFIVDVICNLTIGGAN
jgi:hypothetical protein